MDWAKRSSSASRGLQLLRGDWVGFGVLVCFFIEAAFVLYSGPSCEGPRWDFCVPSLGHPFSSSWVFVHPADVSWAPVTQRVLFGCKCRTWHLHLVLSQRMGLMLAGGTSLSHSLYDTAKTSSADCCGFLLLSHRTEFKQQNDATKPLASEEQPLIKIRW